jgi:outer membrane receptor protein involved in Fe transport
MGNALAPRTTTDFSQSPEVQSLYAAATLSYRNYLYLEMTGRNDWSSALPEDQFSVFYPSVGLTAVVSDMTKLPSWITYGKARVSVATSGYGGSAYLGQEYYTVGAGGLISTPTIQALGNYKPEQTSSLEAGLDWRFLNNRLGFDVTYYMTKTTNQLLLIGAPAASTYNQRYINAGLIRNNGIEVVANIVPLKSSKFTWNTSINFAKNNNKVVSITPEMPTVLVQDDDIVNVLVEAGKSFGTLYVKGWQRDAQGRKLVDAQGRPLLTAGKTIYAGNVNPDFTGGVVNDFKYGNLSFGAQIEFKQGGTIIGGTQALMDADGHSKRSLLGRESGIILDAVKADGTPNTTAITSQAYFSAIGDRKPTGEEYTYSATNSRVREMSLGYTVPSRLLGNSSYLKSAKISLVGRNLFFIKKYAPFDPDIQRGRGGTEQNAAPFTRNYVLNLKLGF